MADIEKLKKKRTIVRTLTTKLVNMIDEVLNDESAEFTLEQSDFLEEKREQLVEKATALRQLDNEIENSLSIDDLENEITTSEDYQEKIIQCKFKVTKYLKRNETISKNVVSKPSENEYERTTRIPETNKITLPKLTINKFYGNPADWIDFFSQFESSIHNNDALTKVDKFAYLKSLLGSTAASAVSGMKLSNENYDTAIQILKDRFGRNDLIISQYMNKLLNLETVRNSQNVRALRRLYDDCDVQVRSLHNLGVASGSFGHLLCPILLNLLPDDLQLDFNRKRTENNWDVMELINFIKTEVECREASHFMNENRKLKNISTPNYAKPDYRKEYRNIPTAAALSTVVKYNCIFCYSNQHFSNSCKDTTVEEKRDKIKKDGRCYRCFRKYHKSSECRVKMNPCELCNSKNHSKSICNVRNKPLIKPSNMQESETVVTSMSHEKILKSEKKSEIYLQTCTAVICSDSKSKPCVCLFDNGSAKSFITSSLAAELKLPILRSETLSVYSFGNREPIQRTSDVVIATLKHPENQQRSITLELLTTDVITGALLRSPNQNNIERAIKRKKKIADWNYGGNMTPVDVLIGGNYFWSVNNGQVRKLDKQIYAIESLLGWTLQGGQESINHSFSVMNVAVESQTGLKEFWELDSLGIREESTCFSKRDNELINSFEDNLKFVNGRYETKLLWNIEKGELENNYEIAKQRFKNLRTKLENDNLVLEKYKGVINDQLKDNIVEECLDDKRENTYYMPHRAIIKEGKSTSVRVVYDASSKGKNCKSLNDCLVSGPSLNPNILDVILKFRDYRIAFCADVEKAFLQIGIAEADRDFLRFFWFSDNPNDNSWKTLRMTRVPFGVTTSPFILSATIKHHIKKYEDEKKECVKMLNNSLYVDDLFYGANDIDNAYDLSSDAVDILRDAGMILRKFKTNSKGLRALWENNGVTNKEFEDNDNSLKVLGIIWNTNEDIFRLEVQPLLDSLTNLKNTKRCVLQTAAKIFDPVGFISPFIIRIKCLFQEIWENGLDWDDELPQELKVKWDSWCSEIADLKKLSFDRTYFPSTFNPVKTELHIFCDASPRAYGTCAYFRYQNEDDEIITNLVMSKSRVAPLKRLTLPRLELMGTVIGSRLAKYLIGVFQITTENVFLWTDSTIALHWIKGSSGNWKPFVANRVEEIQSLTDPKNWKYCQSKENPADLLTRGEKVTSILNSQLWWSGPKWLLQFENSWPQNIVNKVSSHTDVSNEMKTKAQTSLQFSCVVSPNTDPILNIDKYSKLSRLYRVTAWIHRFICNLKNKNEKETGPLTAVEISKAEKYWIKITQRTAFDEEVKQLQRGKNIDKTSRICQFNPQLDINELMILKGRLQFSQLGTQEKHPWILPPENKFVELLVLDVHNKIYHQGVNATLVALREKFWILRSRQMIKSILRKCLICRKFSSPRGTQEVAPLPANRIIESPPFSVTGLDFAGPLFTKDTANKHYILLCTCAVTRAVHLELVSNLSTETFLLAFRRFIARRGLCTTVYSDNAKTFKRADLELKHIWGIMNHPDVQQYYGSKGIQWKFIVDRAAWWGGFWERMVRTVKTCLKKTLGRTSLSLEELETVLVEIEASVNTRPLTHVYDDPDEPSPLTPAHFLLGNRLMHMPSVKLNSPELKANRDLLRKRHQYQLKLLEQFWCKWTKDYLLNLKSFYISRPVVKNVEFKANDVVLIHEDKYPRNLWKLGKIVEVYHGRDGKVRSCALKVKNGIIKRPIQLLHNLEIND